MIAYYRDSLLFRIPASITLLLGVSSFWSRFLGIKKKEAPFRFFDKYALFNRNPLTKENLIGPIGPP